MVRSRSASDGLSNTPSEGSLQAFFRDRAAPHPRPFFTPSPPQGVERAACSGPGASRLRERGTHTHATTGEVRERLETRAGGADPPRLELRPAPARLTPSDTQSCVRHDLERPCEGVGTPFRRQQGGAVAPSGRAPLLSTHGGRDVRAGADVRPATPWPSTRSHTLTPPPWPIAFSPSLPQDGKPEGMGSFAK